MNWNTILLLLILLSALAAFAGGPAAPTPIPVPISMGGTGATTAAEAVTNLAVASVATVLTLEDRIAVSLGGLVRLDFDSGVTATTTFGLGTFSVGAATSTTVLLNGLMQGQNAYSFPASGSILFTAPVATNTLITLLKHDAQGETRALLTALTATYTVQTSDQFLTASAGAGPFTVTLPTAVGIRGRLLEVKKIDPSTYTVILDGAGSETIDGSSTLDIGTQWAVAGVISDGANWLVK